jgi:hypothetical protein
MVTSEVLPKPPRRKRRTRLVTAGMWMAGLTVIGGMIAVFTGARLASEAVEHPLVLGVVISGTLLTLGVLRVLTSRAFKGIVPALATGIVLVVACVGYDEIKHDRGRSYGYGPPVTVETGYRTTRYRIGSYTRLPPIGFEQALLQETAVSAWLQEAVQYPTGNFARDVSLEREANTVWLRMPHYVVQRSSAVAIKLRAVLRELLKARLGDDFLSSFNLMPDELRGFVRDNPVPAAATRD